MSKVRLLTIDKAERDAAMIEELHKQSDAPIEPEREISSDKSKFD